jgi:hypothetical protein
MAVRITLDRGSVSFDGAPDPAPALTDFDLNLPDRFTGSEPPSNSLSVVFMLPDGAGFDSGAGEYEPTDTGGTPIAVP